MTSDELIDKLGERLSEVKRMMSGGFCAYDVENNKAFGDTMKEALENLLNKKYGFTEKKTD